MGFFKAAARRSKRGYRGKLHRCNGGMEQARVLSRDLGGLSFGQDAEGNWGYKTGGADTVTPFKSIKYGSFSVEPNGVYHIDLEGMPKCIVLITDAIFKNTSVYSSKFGHVFEGYDYDRGWLVIDDTGFTWNHSYNWGSGTAYYFYSLTNDIVE